MEFKEKKLVSKKPSETLDRTVDKPWEFLKAALQNRLALGLHVWPFD